MVSIYNSVQQRADVSPESTVIPRLTSDPANEFFG